MEAQGKSLYRFEPTGWDLIHPKGGPRSGTVVVKVQPFGCPTNGTMGHCYVADASTGEFYGLVWSKSLRKISRKDLTNN